MKGEESIRATAGGPMTPAAPHDGDRRAQERKMRMFSASGAFIVGISVILSYQWWADPPSFRPDALNIIVFGVFVAAILYVAGLLTSGRLPPRGLRFCPHCGRQIPFDAVLCPYCGRRLP